MLPIFLTACGSDKHEDYQEDSKAPTSGQTQPTAQNTDDITAMKEKPSADNVFTTVRDAIAKSIGIKCYYTNEDNEKMLTLIKGDKIYIEAMDGKDKEDGIRGLVLNNKMYIWGSKSSDGMIFNFTNNPDKGEETTMDGSQVNSADDIINKVEENNSTCKAETIDPKMFELPSNVQFKDLGW